MSQWMDRRGPAIGIEEGWEVPAEGAVADTAVATISCTFFVYDPTTFRGVTLRFYL